MQRLYDTDTHAWALRQAEALRDAAARHPELAAELDVPNLAMEIEDMGKSLARELVSRLAVLLAHLAKWRWQPGGRSRSWLLTIDQQRDEVAALLADNPSLRPTAQAALAKAWPRARRQAHRETGIAQPVFPEACPMTLDEALAEGWLPPDEA